MNIEYRVVELNSIIPQNAMLWIKENFGDGKDGRWLYRHPRLYFKNSKDHLLFTLKWT